MRGFKPSAFHDLDRRRLEYALGVRTQNKNTVDFAVFCEVKLHIEEPFTDVVPGSCHR